MTTCPSCGHVNEDDTDFCVRCREYLRWDPTEVRPPPQQAATVPAPVAAAVPTQIGDTGAVRVTLRSADGEASAEGRAPATRVTPGARTSVSAVVRNEDSIVDTYALRVEGLPEGWWSVTPQSIHLLPFGSDASGYEQDIEVSLHPPRTPASDARAWPFRLVASSGVHPGSSGAAAGTLVVERYDELGCQLRPERVTARRSARYAVNVRNRGNAPVTISLTATDPDDLLRFAFTPAQLQLGAGAARTVDLRVETAAPAADDRERELRFSIAASSDDAVAAAAGVFVQPAREPSRWSDRSWLLWLRVALTLLAATLLIAGSFAYWTDDGGTALRGACVNGGVSACLDYEDTVDVVAQADVVPDAPDDLPGIVYFVGSAGFLTILLGVVALAGLRQGRSTWLAGVVAVIGLTVLAVQADALPGIWIPILGGMVAIVAGFLPVVASEHGG